MCELFPSDEEWYVVFGKLEGGAVFCPSVPTANMAAIHRKGIICESSATGCADALRKKLIQPFPQTIRHAYDHKEGLECHMCNNGRVVREERGLVNFVGRQVVRHSYAEDIFCQYIITCVAV